MMFRILPVIALFLLVACSAVPTDEYIDQLDELQQSADSTTADLKAINMDEVESLLKQSHEWKERFRPFAGDTLELDFARKLDAYLSAIDHLHYLQKEQSICLLENELATKRRAILRKDIELGAGERATYAKNMERETAEMKKIREHCTILKTQFESAKNVIAENQAVIEQFVTTRESK